MNEGLTRRRTPTSPDTLNSMRAQGRMTQAKKQYDSPFGRYDAMSKRVGDSAVAKYRRGLAR